MGVGRLPLLQLLCAELLLSLALAFGVEPLDTFRRVSATLEVDNNSSSELSTTDLTRTTTLRLSTSVADDLVNTTATVTTTVTTEFFCPLPLALDSSELTTYTGCIKSNCEEMASVVMEQASDGQIANCFLLLEAAGSCAADASAQVTALSSLGLSFEVGDLCGPLCPSYCHTDEATETTSWQRSLVSTSSQESQGEDDDSEDDSRLDLVAAAGRIRVLISSLTFRVSTPERFGKQTTIRKALRDGIATALVVSPSQVVILDLIVPMAEGKESSATQADGNFRRLQVHGGAGLIRVPFEILNAPNFLDANLLLEKSTADKIEVHLRQLVEVGSISDLRLEEPEIVFREVTKKETTVDEWFFTYPVDSKIEDHMEPLEPPGITSNAGCLAVQPVLLAGLFSLLLLVTQFVDR